MDCIVHGIAKSQTGLSDFHCHVLGFPGSSHGKESTCNVGDHGMIPGSGRFPWRRDRLPNPVFMGFPGVSAGKESACNSGDPSSIPGSGRFPWRRDRLPIPVFLGFPGGSDNKESARNIGDLGSIPGLGRSLKKGTATYSSILAWRIPWIKKPGSLRGCKESNTTERLSLTN